MASFEDYDEFGNYIGADIDSEEEADVSQEDITAPHAQQQQPLEGYDDEPIGAGPGTALMEVDEPTHNAVILHEDKQYYPSASEIYGEGVETLVQEEDAQPLTEPIIAPVKVRKWTIEEKDMPETRFDKGYVFRCNVGSAPPREG